MANKTGYGTGTVSKRSDGRWAGRLELGMQNGRRLRKTVYGATEREALTKLARLRADLERGQLPSNDRLTTGTFLEQWLHDLVGTVRPATQASYTHMIRRHVLPGLGHIKLAKLGPRDISQLLSEMLEAGLSPRTVQYAHALLKRALGQAERWEVVPRNVARLVEPPRQQHFAPRALNECEARQLVEAAESWPRGALYIMALSLGLRRGELLGLPWAAIDEVNRRLRVQQTIVQVKGRLYIGEPKTTRSRRVLPLPDICLRALTLQRARQEVERSTCSQWMDSGLVFTSGVGTALDPRNVTRDFHAFCEHAGLPRLRLHDLRHSYCSLLLAQGHSPRVLMELMGHSSISLTMNVYSHVAPEMETAAATAIDLLFAQSRGLRESRPQG